MSIQFHEISADEIAELTATKRSGYAREIMDAFKNAGISGADVSDQFPGKKLSNVANALKRLTQRAEYSEIRVVYVKNGPAGETLVLAHS